jgi:cytochrome c-type biogenesis protein CcmH
MSARRILSLFALGLLLCMAIAGGARADQPLSDPALEARALALHQELRCLVCQGQSIADSNADLARDLRLLVRERLAQGDSDQAVRDYLRARYGDFVLLEPPVKPSTYILWFGPPALLVIGGGAVFLLYRRGRRRAGDVPPPLSEVERQALDRLLDEQP